MVPFRTSLAKKLGSLAKADAAMEIPIMKYAAA
jgi:hypothetical protein